MSEVREILPEADEAEIHRVEQWVSRLLRIGVRLSLAMVILGSIVSFIRHPKYLDDPAQLTRLTHPSASFPHTLRDVASGLAAFRGQAIVIFGLLMLIATPVLRVAVSIIAFVRAKDRSFAIITTIVLTLLLLSFVLGKAG